jgi:WD40 repeat protein
VSKFPPDCAWHGRPVIATGGRDGTVRVWDLNAEHDATLRIELKYPGFGASRTLEVT